MMEQQRRDLNISGVSKTSGGFYDRVSVDGMSKINGDLDCRDLIVNGTLKMRGALVADNIAINGIGTVEGPLKVSTVRVDGVATLRGDVSGGTFEVNGKCRIDGKMEGDRIQIDGVVTIVGDVQCEEFASEGNVQVEGLLNAGSVEMHLYSGSSVQEIGGERIDVRRSERGGFWKGIGIGGTARLKAKVIEGDDVFLEDTEADTVRGARVYIGRGCKIRMVEYRETLDTDPDAKVGSSQQI